MDKQQHGYLHENVQPPRYSDVSSPVGRGLDELAPRPGVTERIISFRDRFAETVGDEAANRAVFEEAVKDVQGFVGPQRTPDIDRKVIEELIANTLVVHEPVAPMVFEKSEALPSEALPKETPLNEALHIQLGGEMSHWVERFWEHEKVTVDISHKDIQAIHQLKDNPTAQKILLDQVVKGILEKNPRAASRKYAKEAIVWYIQTSEVRIQTKAD